MKQPCDKCYNLAATLSWSPLGRVQITERDSGRILISPYADRLLNAEFYPADKKPEDCMDDWPTCPKCGEKLPEEGILDDGEIYNLPDINLTKAWTFLGFLFLGLLLLLFLL